MTLSAAQTPERAFASAARALVRVSACASSRVPPVRPVVQVRQPAVPVRAHQAVPDSGGGLLCACAGQFGLLGRSR
jgi:hypothetical protein